MLLYHVWQLNPSSADLAKKRRCIEEQKRVERNKKARDKYYKRKSEKEKEEEEEREGQLREEKEERAKKKKSPGKKSARVTRILQAELQERDEDFVSDSDECVFL
eukprot:Phypoly_transcript_16878.p1 GENE.Phypoly_transcript_16878~~Phypoly_transcript_16878.p1  ORF type:complete len:105 (-),score=30.38 Phypoly_transcript_16878:78-392(-)